MITNRIFRCRRRTVRLLIPAVLLAGLALLGTGTAQTAAPAQPASRGVPPTLANVRYGPHERNVLNFWRAKSDRPTPLLFRIHGGGWYSGDIHPSERPEDWLDRGISVVSIRYRLTTTDPLPAPVLDAARALQFVRHMAREWNIDSARIVCVGGSAGGCSSLWLALHDDLADPQSADPVARESTKPLGAVATNPQTNLDPRWILEHIGPQANRHPMIFKSFGAPSAQAMIEDFPRYEKAIREFSPINHVDARDPAVYLETSDDFTVPAKNSSHGIHHPAFAAALKERADAVGLRCEVVARDGRPHLTIREFVDGLFAGRAAQP